MANESNQNPQSPVSSGGITPPLQPSTEPASQAGSTNQPPAQDTQNTELQAQNQQAPVYRDEDGNVLENPVAYWSSQARMLQRLLDGERERNRANQTAPQQPQTQQPNETTQPETGQQEQQQAGASASDPVVAQLVTQIETLQAAVDSFSRQQQQEAIQAMRRQAAEEFGLPESLAMRLQGETREDIRADAEALRDSLPGIRAPEIVRGVSPADLGSQPNLDWLENYGRGTFGDGGVVRGDNR